MCYLVIFFVFSELIFGEWNCRFLFRFNKTRVVMELFASSERLFFLFVFEVLKYDGFYNKPGVSSYTSSSQSEKKGSDICFSEIDD